MDYKGVDEDSFTVNLKRKKSPWVLIICLGVLAAIMIPVISTQGKPKVIEEALVSEPIGQQPVIAPIAPAPAPVEPAPIVEPVPVIAPVPEPAPAPVEPEPLPLPVVEPAPVSVPEPVVSYENCTEVRNAGKAPIRSTDPGYTHNLDRDGDGIGCEI